MTDYEESYDFRDCSRGGLGNWKQNARECLLCEHEPTCEHETDLGALFAASSRRSSQLRRAGVQVARRDEMRPRSRSRRPSPGRGETMGGRLVKNIVASVFAAAGHEFGDFFDGHDFAGISLPPDDDDT